MRLIIVSISCLTLCVPCYSGGTAADALLSKQSSRTLRITLAPKSDSAQHLSRATLACPLQSCSYFSSIAALLGNAGQTNYAASNAALEGLAQHQQQQVRSLIEECFLYVGGCKEGYQERRSKKHRVWR